MSINVNPSVKIVPMAYIIGLTLPFLYWSKIYQRWLFNVLNSYCDEFNEWSKTVDTRGQPLRAWELRDGN